MAAGGRLFLFGAKTTVLSKTPFFADMADYEVIERFRLLRERIECLVEEVKEELERNSKKLPTGSRDAGKYNSCFILF